MVPWGVVSFQYALGEHSLRGELKSLIEGNTEIMQT